MAGIAIAASLVANGHFQFLDVDTYLGWAEAALVISVGLIWSGLAALLVATSKGRAYAQLDASDELARSNIETRADSLTIAGLVLAALALAPPSVATSQADQLLGAAFAAFIANWSAGFFPERESSTFVRDAFHWIGLACTLAAVYVIAGTLRPQDFTPRVAIAFGGLAVLGYATGHARAHWRGMQGTPG